MAVPTQINPLDNLDHEELAVRRGPRSGLHQVIAIHSTVRGDAVGGCRLSTYPRLTAGIEDALRLSEAMTYKTAAVNFPNGGGKTVIVLPEGRHLTPKEKRDAMLDSGDFVESFGGRFSTGEDIDVTEQDVAVMAERTRYVFGLPTSLGGVGNPSPTTALGVKVALEQACHEVFGDRRLSGRRLTVIGLGTVGSEVARLCAREGADLLGTDVDSAKQALAEELGVKWVSLDKAVRAECDVLVPCALGGLLDRNTVGELRCRAVVGAANNQLSEEGVATLLHSRGVLWAPDFVANAGGLIHAVGMGLHGFTQEQTRERTEGIADALAQIFDEARKDGIMPLEATMRIVRRRLRNHPACTLTSRPAD
jgi:leucine dehydrogenase